MLEIFGERTTNKPTIIKSKAIRKTTLLLIILFHFVFCLLLNYNRVNANPVINNDRKENSS